MNNSSRKKEQTKVYRRRVLVIFFGLIFTLLALFSVTQYRDVAIVISEETSVYTTPIRENGIVNYLKAFEEECYSSDLTTDKNGFRMIVSNVDLFSGYKSQGFDTVCEKLGLDPQKLAPLLNYEEPHEHIVRLNQAKKIDHAFILELYASQFENDSEGQEEAGLLAMDDYEVASLILGRGNKPWTKVDLPMMESWVDRNSPALDLIGKAVRMPCFEMPLCETGEGLILDNPVYASDFRSVARGFAVRANFYMGMGDVRKAMDDVISCRYLGRHLRNNGVLVDRLIGTAIESISASLGLVNVVDELTDKQDLEYFLDQLNAIPELASADRAMKFEKLLWLELICRESKGLNDDELVGPLFAPEELLGLTSMGIDWNYVAKEFNQLFDESLSTKVYASDMDSVKPQAIDFVSRIKRSRKFGRWIFHNNTGLSQAYFESQNRTTCQSNLQQIVLAMLIYEKVHGALPPVYTIDESGKPLHSWRVLLLPYLGEKKLYNELRLDEPWSSPHNQALAGRRPAVFACPSCPGCQSEETTYTVITGDPGIPFGGQKGQRLSQFGPYSDDMILVTERTDPIHWMDPVQEITLSQAEIGINHDASASSSSITPVGSSHPAGVQCGLRNGSVEFLSELIEAEILRKKLRGTNRRFGEW